LLLEIAEPETEHPALTELRSLDVDSLTPRQAQDALYELQRLLDEKS
jgi:hypothetical protein